MPVVKLVESFGPVLSDDLLWPARVVCERLHIDNSTLWRWLKERPNFPKPIVYKGARYWKVATLKAWVEDLPTATPAEMRALRGRLPAFRDPPKPEPPSARERPKLARAASEDVAATHKPKRKPGVRLVPARSAAEVA
jgi:predicted DNA-binding transcriptional regulator AlpA